MNLDSGVFVRSVLCMLGICLLLMQCKRGEVTVNTGDQQTHALDDINRHISEHPGDPDGYAARAEYNVEHQNYGDAILDMAEAMHRDSVNARYHLLLADIYVQSAKSQLALGTLERAAYLFPDSSNVLLKLAELQLVVRQYDKVSETLRKVMTQDPQNTKALHLLGLMYQEQGNMERAIQTYQTITELDSEDADAWTTLGNLYDIQHNPLALQCFENAIAVAPAYPQGWHSKAFYLQNHGKIPEAIGIYKHIHTIAPNYADAWLNQGILYMETDSSQRAVDCFDQLIRLDSTSAQAWYLGGIASKAVGDVAGAKEKLAQAYRLQPSSERIKTALEDL